MDAVLLSSFAKVKKQERALDLGTGTGILPILLEAKNEGAHYTGLEIQKESVDMARRSVMYNGLLLFNSSITHHSSSSFDAAFFSSSALSSAISSRDSLISFFLRLDLNLSSFALYSRISFSCPLSDGS